MPTLVPTVNGLMETIPGLSVQSLVTAIGLGAYATGILPLSTTGGNVLANFGTVYSPKPDEEKKLFNQLLILAVASMAAYALAVQTSLLQDHHMLFSQTFCCLLPQMVIGYEDIYLFGL